MKAGGLTHRGPQGSASQGSRHTSPSLVERNKGNSFGGSRPAGPGARPHSQSDPCLLCGWRGGEYFLLPTLGHLPPHSSVEWRAKSSHAAPLLKTLPSPHVFFRKGSKTFQASHSPGPLSSTSLPQGLCTYYFLFTEHSSPCVSSLLSRTLQGWLHGPLLNGQAVSTLTQPLSPPQPSTLDSDFLWIC